MPRNKDLKRLVRARMSKTGESYTAARAKVIARSTTERTSGAVADVRASASPAAPVDYAAVAGFSDAAIKARTGCTWDRWVFALDHYHADKMSHGEIAALVASKYKIDGWWAQAVTVGYERIKGLRAIGQRRDGTYEANKSRTFNVPVTTLFDAWANARTRRRWLSAPPRRRNRCVSTARIAASSPSGSCRRGARRARSRCSTPSSAIATPRIASRSTGPSASTRSPRCWLRKVRRINSQLPITNSQGESPLQAPSLGSWKLGVGS